MAKWQREALRRTCWSPSVTPYSYFLGPGVVTANLSPGPHLGIVDMVGAAVLSKLAERLKPGGIRKVRADSAWEWAGV